MIIFPDDCEFQAVPACTTGRVFILKFKTSNKRVFFWMQVRQNRIVVEIWVSVISPNINFLKVSVMVHVTVIL